MLPLRRIFSISDADLQTIAMSSSPIRLSLFSLPLIHFVAGSPGALALDHLENLLRNLVYRQVSVYGNQPPLAGVVLGHGLGLLFVSRQTVPDDFFTVIIPGHQRRTINIAFISDTGWLGVYVVDPSTDGTRTASGEPTQQKIIVHVNSDHNGQQFA